MFVVVSAVFTCNTRKTSSLCRWKAWAQVRDDSNANVDWLIAAYQEGSKTDITILAKGNGNLEACAGALPDGQPVFGGCKLKSNGRFVTFFHVGEGTSVMSRGRASMHKNGKEFVVEFS